MVIHMNKTILLACCDFLILATLALTSFKTAAPLESQSEMLPENTFQLNTEEEAQEDLVESFYALKVEEINKKLNSVEADLEKTEEELTAQKLISQNKEIEIQRLKSIINKKSKSVYKSVLNNLWQVNVSMKEDDSFSPDSFQTDFFSCAFTLNDKTYLLAEFNKLGFNWAELIADGNISNLKIIIAKTGPNPWSTASNGPIYSLNQAPAACLIEIPKSRVYSPLDILPYPKLPDYLDKIYAAKSDGRIIKVKNLAVIPNRPDWIVLDEERFLGHPDKVEKGDILVTSDGSLVGIVSREERSGNKKRLMCFALSQADFSESQKIPIQKQPGSLHYKDFVDKARLLAKTLQTNK